MTKPRLSVIIPAYNEQDRIGATLQSVSRYLSKQDYAWEVLVANDGSKDNTAKVVKHFTLQDSRFRILDNKENHGKGYVVKQAMLQARGDVRLFMDADNSTSIDHIEKMWPYFEKGYEVVIGSRRVPGAKIAVHQSWYKELLGRIGNLVIQIFAVPGISDTQAGFKAFSAKAAEDIFKRVKDQRWAFDVEALAIARKLKYKIAQIPIYWVNDPKSHVKFIDYLTFNFAVLKIRLNLWSGKY